MADHAWQWVNRFAHLPTGLYSRVQPTPLPAPYWVSYNPALAATLGLAPGSLLTDAQAQVWCGNQLATGSIPLAALYAGHQFGHWVPQLGDGRAMLLGEILVAGQHHELQLKGAGPTPYSRGGDGRAVLRSSIREYLCSEAMHGLGIPTTRALALVGSPQPVWREQLETAAVVTRVAPSFVRFGSFEVLAHRQQLTLLRRLADHIIDDHWPDLRAQPAPYQGLLERVIARTAALIAHWQAVGFCHGVMNSDNMSILGLTLDYGPFGFLDGYHPAHICNHSDHEGRYAYDQQPQIGLFNLHCLAQALLPLLDYDATVAALQSYQAQFDTAYLQHMRAKLGLLAAHDHDGELVARLLHLMAGARTDYTLFWRMLAGLPLSGDTTPWRDHVLDRTGFDAWVADYRQRLRWENRDDTERGRSMRSVNPRFILRNHLAETAIRAAADHGAYDEIERLRTVLAQPYAEQPAYEHYACLPPDWAASLSVSCSS
jgi:uncharacterized protein YdiU (UPF0061 family)